MRGIGAGGQAYEYEMQHGGKPPPLPPIGPNDITGYDSYGNPLYGPQMSYTPGGPAYSSTIGGEALHNLQQGLNNGWQYGGSLVQGGVQNIERGFQNLESSITNSLPPIGRDLFLFALLAGGAMFLYGMASATDEP